MGASKPTSTAASEQDPLSEALDVDADEYDWVREQLESAGIQLQHARLEDDDGGGPGGDGGDGDDDGDDDGQAGGGWRDPSPGGALGELLALLEEEGNDDEGDEAEEGELLANKVDALIARLAPQEAGGGEEQKQKKQAQLLSLPGPDGDTALHLAALYGRAGAARRLLAAGADPCAVNPEDGTLPLHDAAAGGYNAIVGMLLEGIAAAAAAAAAAGGGAAEAAAVKAALAHGDEDGDTPLHCAARGGHVSTVLRLLKAGADATLANEKGCTPSDESDDDKVRALLSRVVEKAGPVE